MIKPDETKEKIINEAMLLFNVRGIAATSIQEIMQATGLPKGAIYRRFETKEAIVLAAFARAGEILKQCFAQAVEEGASTLDKLLRIAAIYQDAVDAPPIPGGCPLLNMAVESDGTFPELRQKAAEAYGGMVKFVEAVIGEGIRNGEFREDLDAAEMAPFLIDSMEGAIMASRLTGSNAPVERNMRFTEMLLRSYMNA